MKRVLIIIVGLLLIFLLSSISIAQNTCPDGTLPNECSTEKPKYCTEGGEEAIIPFVLINNCAECGCPEDQICQDNGKNCISAQACKDGTLYGECSTTKPKYCIEGGEEAILPFVLINDCTVCSCFPGYECQTDGSCVPIQMCGDGTPYGECSVNKPKYCIKGDSEISIMPFVFINNCAECGCPEDQICQDSGACIEKEVIEVSENEKLMKKYSDKEVFLISDKNWKDVLPFVPVAIWTDDVGNIHKYPFLIYHEEETGFDADSIIYFMQQYQPSKVTIIGETPQELTNLLIAEPELGAGLSIENNQIQTISADNYLSYWKSFDKVVYVQDNYELALLASTYASLINAPLIIKGTDYDTEYVFTGREIVCIGSVSPTGNSCTESYNLEELQQKYVDETNTDKIILINPDDLYIKVVEEFTPEKSGNPIYEIYSKTSLAAPILASAKHKLVIFTKNNGYREVDSDFTNRFFELFDYNEDDFKTKECKIGDDCSEGWSIYNLPIEETIEDTIGLKFDIGDIENLADIDYLMFDNLLVQESCFHEAEPKYIITINRKEYVREGDYGWGGDNLLDGYIEPMLNIKRQQLSESPIKNNILNVSIQIPNCKIIQRTDDVFYDTHLFIYLISGEEKKYNPIEEKNIIEKTMEIKGIEANENAYFDFSDLNNRLNYRILLKLPGKEDYICKPENPCNGPYFNNKETQIIGGSEIVDNKARIRVDTTSDLEEPIFPLVSVKLVPLLPEDFYLTIVASPDAIQMTSQPVQWISYTFRYALDFYYSTLNEDYYPHEKGRKKEYAYYTKLFTGRIFGITLSDASSYIARDLFFEQIQKNRYGSFIIRGTSPDYTADFVKKMIHMDRYWGEDGLDVYNQFPDGVYTCYSYYDEVEGCDTHEEETKNSYYDSYFTFYNNHGSYKWAFVSSYDLDNRYLQPKINIISACDTCDFVYAKEREDTKNLFCMQNLRRGNLIYLGAQSISFQSSNTFMEMIGNLVLEKQTIGKVFHRDVDLHKWGYPVYNVLIGDPTIKPIFW